MECGLHDVLIVVSVRVSAKIDQIKILIETLRKLSLGCLNKDRIKQASGIGDSMLCEEVAVWALKTLLGRYQCDTDIFIILLKSCPEK